MKNKPDSHGVTGKYANPPGGWNRILKATESYSHLKILVDNYHKSKHPACLNAIMDNAPADLWLVYYSK